MQTGTRYFQEKLQTIAEVREIVLHELHSLQDFCTISQANGAFYFMLKVNTQLSAMELVEQLIREHGVAAIPGTTFGMEDGCYLRIAYGAMLHEAAKEGIGRLVRGLQAICKF